MAKKQRVLITAGASGIGRAMAEAFAEAGAEVWVTDVDGAALAACPDDWRRTQADVTDEAAIAGLFAEIAAEWGGLDTLCANAGIAGPTALVEDVALEDWRRCVSVNLEGAFLSAKHAAPMMKTAGAGAIIAIPDGSSTLSETKSPINDRPVLSASSKLGGILPPIWTKARVSFFD